MALRGDLADASPAELIANLGEQQASGALAIDRSTRMPAGAGTGDGQATLHLRNGAVYAAALDGGTFPIGTRLSASHGLGAPALAEALRSQQGDLAGWRLGEILVHLGHVHADVVEQVSLEQVLEIATEVSGWRAGSWKFRSGERTRGMLAHPIAAEDLVQRVQARNAEWRDLLPTVGGRRAPILRTSGAPPLDASRELVALLRAAEEQPAEAGLEVCSHAAGLSMLEGARLVVSARAAGLLAPLPVEERIAVGGWTARHHQTGTTAPPAGLMLAPRPVPAPSAPEPGLLSPGTPRRSVALARLMELEGPVPAQAVTVEERSPEEIVADLEPDVGHDSGPDATVLDLAAARAAKTAELAMVEEAATTSALAEQLRREQTEREAEERAVADALRRASEARAAAEAATRRERVAAAVDAAASEVAAVHAPVAPVAAFTTAVASPVQQLTAGERLGMFSVNRDPLADTASLLRELSSLGDDEAEPAEARPSARPGAAGTPSAAKVSTDKKRKGLFGR